MDKAIEKKTLAGDLFSDFFSPMYSESRFWEKNMFWVSATFPDLSATFPENWFHSYSTALQRMYLDHGCVFHLGKPWFFTVSVLALQPMSSETLIRRARIVHRPATDAGGNGIGIFSALSAFCFFASAFFFPTPSHRQKCSTSATFPDQKNHGQKFLLKEGLGMNMLLWGTNRNTLQPLGQLEASCQYTTKRSHNWRQSLHMECTLGQTRHAKSCWLSPTSSWLFEMTGCWAAVTLLWHLEHFGTKTHVWSWCDRVLN